MEASISRPFEKFRWLADLGVTARSEERVRVARTMGFTVAVGSNSDKDPDQATPMEAWFYVDNHPPRH
jgi:hypothetical protein